MTPPSVLIVDDESSMVDLLEHALRKCGYSIQRGRDGIDAFSHLFSHPPSVMLIDLRLPCMNGLEVIEQIRTDRRLSSLPILAMSADPQLLDQARDLGADAVLSKPFHMPEVVALVERHTRVSLADIALAREGAA